MWPVKPQMDMWSVKPAMKSNYKKSIGLNKNGKATTCEYNDSKSQSPAKYMCSDKNCQEIKRPRKPRNVMWSVTKETDMQLPRLARLCSDKNCQSTRCYRSPRRPLYSCDKTVNNKE